MGGRLIATTGDVRDSRDSFPGSKTVCYK